MSVTGEHNWHSSINPCLQLKAWHLPLSLARAEALTTCNHIEYDCHYQDNYTHSGKIQNTIPLPVVWEFS
jgi:hypothetical protein